MTSLSTAILALVLLTGQKPDEPTPADVAEFTAAQARARFDVPKLIKLALWCEERHMEAQKRAVLEQVIRLSPNHATAHGLLGEVFYKGKWAPADTVSREMQEDRPLAAKNAQYIARREQIERDTATEWLAVQRYEKVGLHQKAAEVKAILDHRVAAEHVRIGLWCESNGLKPEAQAHLTTALHLNPRNEATWKHLGYVKHHGRWMNHEQIAAEERQLLAQKRADRH